MALTKVGKEGITGISNSSDATAITIDSSERVGIGETSPQTKLHIKTADASATAQSGSALVIEGTDATRADLQFLGDASAFQAIHFGDNSDADIGRIAYDHGGNTMRFNVNAAEAGRITSDGLDFRNASGTKYVLFKDGDGLHFGASLGSGASSSVLDDYEEGTATLSFSSSGSTFQYSYQIAFYTKVGRNVHLVCYMQLDGGGNSFSSNTVTITGLPFTSLNNAAHQAVAACRIRFVNLGTGFTYLMATIGSNTTTVGLSQCGDNVATGTIGANQLSSSSGQVMFSLSYVAA